MIRLRYNSCCWLPIDQQYQYEIQQLIKIPRIVTANRDILLLVPFPGFSRQHAPSNLLVALDNH